MRSDAGGSAAPVRQLGVAQPLSWLLLGWRDFRAELLLGLLHGFLVAAGGAVIALLGWGRHDLLAGAFSGFLLMAPLLAGGLYAISRARAAGQVVSVHTVSRAWRAASGAQLRLGVLLAALGSLWVGLSALIIVGWSGVRASGIMAFLVDFVAAPDWRPFAVWLAAGGLFAALVFAISAVSVPMLLDRDVTLRCALLTSVRAVGANPQAMLLWAALLMVAVLAAMVLVLPMLVAVPVLGHATWYAYRDCVDAGSLPARA